MGEADHSPTEQGKKRGQVGEPGKDLGTRVAYVQVCEAAANDEGRDEAVPWSTTLISILEDLG
jgi:hypothetical protein